MKASTYALPAPVRVRIKTWIPSLALLPACLYVCAHRGEYLLTDTLNLLIHEAGHLCFYFFGDLIHAAGGSMMQVILPAIVAWHFYQYRSLLGVQVSLLWLGQNLLNISVYAADARSQELSLLVNRKHDWHHMLEQTGLLSYDQVFAYGFCVLAMFAFIGLLALPFFHHQDERSL